MRVAFGQFVADTQAERLWKDGLEVRLREQPLQVLFALLRNAGEVVSRDTLRQNLWGNSTYVDFDNGLNTAISRLREMLEDDSTKPVWIETVPKRGYRFIGSLPRPAAVAAYLKGHHVISTQSGLHAEVASLLQRSNGSRSALSAGLPWSRSDLHPALPVG